MVVGGVEGRDQSGGQGGHRVSSVNANGDLVVANGWARRHGEDVILRNMHGHCFLGWVCHEHVLEATRDELSEMAIGDGRASRFGDA